MLSNFHSKPFDGETLIKLDIWRRYLETWIPVFVANPLNSIPINVFDFFSGPGIDESGNFGSPIIALQEASKYRGQLIKSNKKINFFFFDGAKRKVDALRKNVELYIDPEVFNIHIECLSFSSAFGSNLPRMGNSANLLFIDQCGIKEVTPEVFKKISVLRTTDLIFFIASSYFARFVKSSEFQNYLSVTPESIEETSYKDIHRLICKFYRKVLPVGSQYSVIPFSIKKGSNIYGVIFGSRHLKGNRKFLEVCWKIDPVQGEANYDIDEDNITSQISFFPEDNKASKLRKFEREISEAVLSGELKTDADIYIYILENGFLPVHVRDVMKGLIKEKQISIDGGKQLRLSEAAINEPRYIVIS